MQKFDFEVIKKQVNIKSTINFYNCDPYNYIIRLHNV